MGAIEIRTLEIFATVCELGSMTDAARSLGITQSAVSQQIAHLEQLVGASMLDRAMRPMSLTQAGRIIRDRAQAILADARSLCMAIAEGETGRMAELRLGISEGISPSLAATLTFDLAKSVERLSLVSNLAEGPSAALRRRAIDMAVTLGEVEPDDALECEEIGHQRCVFVTAEPEELEPTGSGRFMHERPYVRYAANAGIARPIERHLRRQKFTPSRSLNVDQVEVLADIVSRIGGWSIVPEMLACHPRFAQLGIQVSAMPRGMCLLPLSVIGHTNEQRGLRMRIAAAVKRLACDEPPAVIVLPVQVAARQSMPFRPAPAASADSIHLLQLSARSSL
ncbi:LysR family transcriptional regulator [Boseaceae bacterium BT-24-1]|nr:LysR family transcriptional regulator [Boseaceae bacterium BT-24-1]